MNENLNPKLLVSSSLHYGRKIIIDIKPDYHMATYVKQNFTAASLLITEKDIPIISIKEFPIISKFEKGPCGDYDGNFTRYFMLLGEFLFFVETKNDWHDFGKTSLSGQVSLIDFKKRALIDNVSVSKKLNNYYGKEFFEIFTLSDTLIPIHTGERIIGLDEYTHYNENIPNGIVSVDGESLENLLSVKINGMKIKEGIDYDTNDFIIFDLKTYDVDEINGAARLFVDGYGWRFIIPSVNGVAESLKNLRESTHRDDWIWIKTQNIKFSNYQKNMLVNHFQNTGIDPDVEKFCSEL